jgi:hypothetical protein
MSPRNICVPLLREVSHGEDIKFLENLHQHYNDKVFFSWWCFSISKILCSRIPRYLINPVFSFKFLLTTVIWDPLFLVFNDLVEVTAFYILFTLRANAKTNNTPCLASRAYRIVTMGWDYILVDLQQLTVYPDGTWATVEWYWHGKSQELSVKLVPVPLCTRQLSGYFGHITVLYIVSKSLSIAQHQFRNSLSFLSRVESYFILFARWWKFVSIISQTNPVAAQGTCQLLTRSLLPCQAVNSRSYYSYVPQSGLECNGACSVRNLSPHHSEYPSYFDLWPACRSNQDKRVDTVTLGCVLRQGTVNSWDASTLYGLNK